MSTRATYEFKSKETGTRVLYCYYDNYTSGAAQRLLAALDALTGTFDGHGVRSGRGGWYFSFIRGNVDAEPAFHNDRDGHGDTDYHYAINEDAGTITQYKRLRYDAPADGEAWETIWYGPISQFINHGHRDGIQQAIAYMRRTPDVQRQIGVNVADFVGTADVTMHGQTVTLTASVAKARQIAMAYKGKSITYEATNPNHAYCLKWAAAWQSVVRNGRAAAKPTEALVSAYKKGQNV